MASPAIASCRSNLAPLALAAVVLGGAVSTELDAASVRFAWDASPDASVTGYRLYWGIGSGSYTNSVSAGNNLSGTITGLTANVTYYFAATAYDANGIESPFSNEVRFHIPTNAPLVPPFDLHIQAALSNGASMIAGLNLDNCSFPETRLCSAGDRANQAHTPETGAPFAGDALALGVLSMSRRTEDAAT